VLIAVYLYLSSVLILFPWTRGLAGSLVSLLVDPLRTIGLGFLQNVPKLAFLVILFIITRYLLKLIRLYFQNIADGSAVLPGFDPEWAEPTYRLIRILLVAFMVIVAYPYIPGSGSEAFKGVSLFIGVLFSLGSSSLIGNLIAGYTMTYRRAFRIGDRVMIGTYLGDVEQVRLMVTYLRTLKNELVAIPNSMILNGEVVNYSTLASKQGLILHTTVGIGYETPWRQVEGMLLEAAARVPGLLREPPPYVLYKGLGDFCITYEINAFCADPQAMFQLYAELQRNILDLFNEYGVQIMTPAYEGDPEEPKVVPKDQWWSAPARPAAPGGPGPLEPAPSGSVRRG
jgi:small-conductance mechanosensitive channel